MKRCPVCNTTFDDPYLSFCPNDGTPLVRMSPDEAHTVLMSSPESDPAATVASNLPPAPQPYGWANDTPVQWTPPPPPAIRGSATQQQQTLAVASMILGLVGITFGWICGGPFFALFALVMGIVALFQIKKDPTRYGGKPMALIGVALGAIVLAIYIVLMAVWIIMKFAGAVR